MFLLWVAPIQEVASSSAGLGITAFSGLLLTIWRIYLTSKKSRKTQKHVTDFSKIARKVKEDDEYDIDEFDVIIVGRGAYGIDLNLTYLQNVPNHRPQSCHPQAQPVASSLLVYLKIPQLECCYWKPVKGTVIYSRIHKFRLLNQV